MTVFLDCLNTFLETMPLIFQNSKHKSITSHPVSQNNLFLGQNEILHSKPFTLAEKTNFALRQDTQALKITHITT